MSRRRRWMLAAGLVVGVVVLVVAHAPLLDALGSQLLRSDPLRPCDAIVVLAGDSRGERMASAIELWRQGYGKRIVFWGGRVYWKFSYADLYLQQLQEAGVPREALLWSQEELTERSTVGEARLLVRLLEANGCRDLLLVTSPYHTRRAGWIFEREGGRHGIQVVVRPSRDSEVALQGWWRHRAGAKIVFLEYQKLAYESFRRLVSE